MQLMFEPEENIDKISLCQGDLLQRTDSLLEAVRQAHSYYAEAADYEFFMVLTQSCDLVRRGKKPCKSRYITIAAVRPLEILVDRLISKYAENNALLPVPLYPKQNEPLVRNMLERVMHNTADGVFFLKQGSHPALTKHYCAFLTLSVALRATHYDACINAKVAQLKDVFQAKLGWLTGNLYSRVGTPDEEGDPEVIRDEFLSSVLYDKTIWLTPEQRNELIKKAKSSKPATKEDVIRLVSELKDDAKTLSDRIVENILREYIKDNDALAKIANKIMSDKVIARIIRGQQVLVATD